MNTLDCVIQGKFKKRTKTYSLDVSKIRSAIHRPTKMHTTKKKKGAKYPKQELIKEMCNE